MTCDLLLQKFYEKCHTALSLDLKSARQFFLQLVSRQRLGWKKEKRKKNSPFMYASTLRVICANQPDCFRDKRLYHASENVKNRYHKVARWNGRETRDEIRRDLINREGRARSANLVGHRRKFNIHFSFEASLSFSFLSRVGGAIYPSRALKTLTYKTAPCRTYPGERERSGGAQAARKSVHEWACRCL